VIAVLNMVALVLDFLLFSSFFAPTPADDRATQVVPPNGVENHKKSEPVFFNYFLIIFIFYYYQLLTS
jgi:hypothetical protein